MVSRPFDEEMNMLPATTHKKESVHGELVGHDA